MLINATVPARSCLSCLVASVAYRGHKGASRRLVSARDLIGLLGRSGGGLSLGSAIRRLQGGLRDVRFMWSSSISWLQLLKIRMGQH
jgi:hypothetical protein